MSTSLLGFDGLWGLKGWQCMYVFEAIPTVLIGVAVFFYLTDRPEQASWLAPDEKKWLASGIALETAKVERENKVSLMQSFWDPRVVLLSLNYLGIVTASLGMLLFLPQIVKQLGVTNMQVGWVTMIPYGCGAVSMVVCGYIADRVGDRRWTLFWTCVIATIGLIMAALTLGTWWAVVGMSIAAIGFYGNKGAVLGDPDDVADRQRCRGRHRLDQLARQSRRVLWAEPRRLGQGDDRQLRRRALCPAVCALASAIISLFWIRVPRAATTAEIAVAAE